MIPLSDGIPAQRFPFVNVALIAVNFAVFLFYELPDPDAAISHASFYPCSIENACSTPEPWGVAWITAMFMHAGWDHILGNMLWLAIFGKNVESAFGPLSYLVFYFAGGFFATMVQTAMTLLSGPGAGPTLGASGAIAAVLGAYFMLYPNSRVRTLVLWLRITIPGLFYIRIPAWFYLGGWFLYQFVVGNYGLIHTNSGGSGVAFFAHAGGFVFGVVVARVLIRAGRITVREARWYAWYGTGRSAFREVEAIEVREILRAWLAGKGQRSAARQAGVNRKTVVRYVQAAVAVGLARDGGEEQLTDELIGQVVAAVRPDRPNDHGAGIP